MRTGIQRWAMAFKSVDWLIPAYLTMGYLSSLAAAIEQEESDGKQKILEYALSQTYDEIYLSRMLLGIYSKIPFVRDFRIQISEAIEASFSGCYNAAVATMIPVLEGVVRKIARAAQRNVGSGTQKLIAEFDRILEKENQSPSRFEERVVMLEALRDFFADKLLKNTESYAGMDEFNRHGILHGIFESYGVKINFLRAVTILDLLCFVVTYLYGGFSVFAPEATLESLKLAEYYKSLALRKPESIRSILLFA